MIRNRKKIQQNFVEYEKGYDTFHPDTMKPTQNFDEYFEKYGMWGGDKREEYTGILD